MNLLGLNLDDMIGDLLIKTNIFKNIHPNIITILGIILNLVIFNLIKNENLLVSNILIIVRCLCDIMDGTIARKYKKSSKIGGLLDTICDFMFIQLYIYLIVEKLFSDTKIIYGVITFTSLLNIYFMKDSITDHSNLNNSKTLVGNIIEFSFKNNSIITFSFITIFNVFFFKKKID